MDRYELIEKLLDMDLDLLMEDIIDMAYTLDHNYMDKPSNYLEDDKEMNLIAEKLGNSKKQDFTSRLFFAYQVLGLQFIVCDGKVEDDELLMFFSQIDKIAY